MKPTTTAKPLLILVIGTPGSGKSFFARQFSQSFGAPVISYNRLQHELFNQPEHTVAEQSVIQRVMSYIASEMTKSRRSFILDGGYQTKTSRQQLASSARGHGYEVLNVWVQTDDPTCLYRSTRNSNRTEDDQYRSVMDEASYEALAKKFAVPALTDNAVVISGKHTFSAQSRSVLRRMAAKAPTQTAVKAPSIPILFDDANTPYGGAPDTQSPKRKSVIIN